MTTHDSAPGSEPVRVDTLDDGAIWRVCLAKPKANVLDAAMVDRLTHVFEDACDDRGLKAVILDGEGPHFSFGASVEEHLPGRFHSMLRGFHGLFGWMLEASVPTLAAVHGQCLGGGLELASFATRVFASPDARLGQPEIVLGVFPPVASVALAERVGRPRAEDLCLSGRVLTAEEAAAIGLVDVVADDPTAAALAYARQHLLPRSASSLRCATHAIRLGFAQRFRTELEAVERLYIDELMSTADAEEGLRAFLDKRRPEWSNA